jgi:hypothetical protein
MLGGWIALVALGIMVVGPLLWRVHQDRRTDRAQAVAAQVRAVLFRAFGGESLVSVDVQAPSLRRAGRVVLNAPSGYHRLLESQWSGVAAVVPAEYELVVRPVVLPRSVPALMEDVPLRRAA